MKPAWDRLMDDFKGSSTSLVADVDCTESGKDLCEKYEVQGFPTIKYGDPDDLKAYEGGRDYEDLKKFADENLGPTCGPTNLDLCSAQVRAKIEGYMKMTSDRLEGKIRNAQKVVAEEVPLMKKVLAHKGDKSKSEL
mmetsp:Transcript_99252/g.315069  ORF Transcript_99252/g.315069 Transcript_99252/m.315069 type:complete len:137 (-) Transcript_99252:203-613(-)